jgi:hypothetical protein
MKFIIVLLALSSVGCSLLPTHPKEVYYEWNVDSSDKAKVDQANLDQKECADFAYKSIIKGSRYTENSILNGCMDRKGYKLNRYVVGD